MVLAEWPVCLLFPPQLTLPEYARRLKMDRKAPSLNFHSQRRTEMNGFQVVRWYGWRCVYGVGSPAGAGSPKKATGAGPQPVGVSTRAVERCRRTES